MLGEYETEVENQRLMAAVFDDAQIKLNFRPYNELKDFESNLPGVTLAHATTAGSLAGYFFGLYLRLNGDDDLFAYLNDLDAFKRSHPGERREKAQLLIDAHFTSKSHADDAPPAEIDTTSGQEENGAAASQAEASPSEVTLAEKAGRILAAAGADALAAVQTRMDPEAKESKELPLELFDSVHQNVEKTLLVDAFGNFKTSPQYKRLIQAKHYASQPVDIKSFRPFRILGRGAYGAVSAVQKKDTHAIFAMKEMDKKKIKGNQCEDMVTLEQEVLSRMRSPFVLNLRYSFTDEDSACLIFDLCSGGDLKFHMRREPEKRFDEAKSRFYAAEVLLGLEHIHSFDMVYRDLKPHNIMLTKTGHCMISDLGLTVYLRQDKPIRQLAGTPGYWPPEILRRTGTHKSSDWWSFGVFLYEMIAGRTPRCRCDLSAKERSLDFCPFGHDPQEEINARKPDGRMLTEVKFNDKFSPEAIDLISKLLNPDPEARLGAKGVEEVKEHPFFAGIDWHRLGAQQVDPPFVPSDTEVNARDLEEVGDFRRTKFEKVKITEEEEKKWYEKFAFVNKESVEEELVNALLKMEEFEKSGRSEQAKGCCVIC